MRATRTVLIAATITAATACSGTSTPTAAPSTTGTPAAASGNQTTTAAISDPTRLPACSDALVEGKTVSAATWKNGCTRDGKIVLAFGWDCKDGRKFWANDLGYGYNDEPFHVGDKTTEQQKCVFNAVNGTVKP